MLILDLGPTVINGDKLSRKNQLAVINGDKLSRTSSRGQALKDKRGQALGPTVINGDKPTVIIG